MRGPFAFVTTVVLADVRRRLGLVLALALATTGYLWLWFPPAEVRATLHAAAATERAIWLLLAWATYLRVTAFASARAVGSSEVMHLRHLPIAARSWQRMHVVHLAVLEWPLAAAVAYGVAPTWAHARGDAIAWCVAATIGTMAWRVVALATRDRSVVARAGIAAATAAIVGGAIVMAVAAVALGLASIALAWAWRRLARPLPGVRGARTLPAFARGPLGALVWLWLALAWAHDRTAIAVVAAVEVLAVAAIALAWRHVGGHVHGNVAAAIALFCSLGVAPVVWLGLRNERRLALERHALDPLIGVASIELLACVMATAALALPMLVGWTALVAVGVPQPGIAVPLTIATVTIACGPAVLALSTYGQLHDRLHAPMVRAVAAMLAAQALVLTTLGCVATLALAAALAAWSWRRAPLATRVRQRRARATQAGHA